MLDDVEKEFNIAIHVYSLNEKKIAKVERLSQNYNTKEVLHLNLYENHFSYISLFLHLKSHMPRNINVQHV